MANLPIGADLLQLDRAAAPARGLTTWLAAALRAGIRDGRLRPGTALPATRLLADDLGVSRGVVVEAYQRLREEGLVGARSGAGTTILPPSARPAAAQASSPGPIPQDDPLSLPRRWGADAEIDLSPGVPDLSAFPRAAWLRAERAVLPRPARPTSVTATRAATSRGSDSGSSGGVGGLGGPVPAAGGGAAGRADGGRIVVPAPDRALTRPSSRNRW